MYFCGSANYDLEQSLPPGTAKIDLQVAPSGHLVITCTYFAEMKSQEQAGGIKNEEVTVLPVAIARDNALTSQRS